MEDKESIIFELKKKPLQSEKKEKRHKILKTFLTIILCLVLLVTGAIGGVLGYKIIHPTLDTNSADVFDEMAYILSNFYLYSKDDPEFVSDLIDKALYGMASFEDDPYTTYMSSKQLEEFATSINKDFIGIGVQYTKVNGAGLITKVFIDSPAEKAGLKVGDLFYEVDGISIEDLTADEIKEMVIGQIGTEVVLTVKRDNETLTVPIIRGEVSYTVSFEEYEDYIYLAIESFGQTTGKEIKAYLDRYYDSNIIIDIRDNTGGYQTSVKEVCGLFMGDNVPYLKQEDNLGNVKTDYTSCSKTYDFEKIVILTNSHTASASEVFAIALKEALDNVTIVGTTTYGKGVIQNTHMLSNGAALKFTDYFWYSPNGVSIHKVGVKPDIEVKLDEINYEPYISMNDDEVYKQEDVSDTIRLASMCLEYLGYDVDHTNGYFDYKMKESLKDIQNEYGLSVTGNLDKKTYELILSNAVYEMSTNIDKDYQLIKAREIVCGN